MKTYYVYILECADRLLYTGFTNNIFRRLAEHQEGRNPSCFTYRRRPVELIFHQQFNDVNKLFTLKRK